MKPSRLRTLLIGLTAGVAYAIFTTLLVSQFHQNVSVAYIFVLPLVLGAIPVLFSTKEQLKTYTSYIILPWGITLSSFLLMFVSGFEGLICLVIIIVPFLLLGTLGTFVFRLIKLSYNHNQNKLYASLLLPFVVLLAEANFSATDQFYTVKTVTQINAPSSRIWENIKNVKNIQDDEIPFHFGQIIGIPNPIDGRLSKDGVGGIRHIRWDKGIRFQEVIKTWQEGKGFSYDINVDPNSIPPTTLDEHVMIGGRYFDVIDGAYRIDSVSKTSSLVTLTCRYRITTNLNLYAQFWGDFMLNDFNEMILQIIKNRCEKL